MRDTRQERWSLGSARTGNETQVLDLADGVTEANGEAREYREHGPPGGWRANGMLLVLQNILEKMTCPDETCPELSCVPPWNVYTIPDLVPQERRLELVKAQRSAIQMGSEG